MRVTLAHPSATSSALTTAGFEPHQLSIRVFLPPSSDVPKLGHSFLFPIFFGLTARVIPLRSGLRVFCFIGSALNNTGFPPIKQTLACDSKPPRSLSCPKENGAERKVKTKCLIYMLSGIALRWGPLADVP